MLLNSNLKISCQNLTLPICLQDGGNLKYTGPIFLALVSKTVGQIFVLTATFLEGSEIYQNFYI